MKQLPKIIIDTREQTPFVFAPDVETVAGTLQFGDYSLEGFTDLVVIERKSLPDIVACCGSQRDRFKRELATLRGYKYKAVIIESTLQKVTNGKWRGKVQPAHVLGSIASWRLRYGIDFIYAGSPELAAKECYRFLNAVHNLIEEFVRRFK